MRLQSSSQSFLRLHRRLKDLVERISQEPPDHPPGGHSHSLSRSHGKAGRFARPTPHTGVTDAVHGASITRDGDAGKRLEEQARDECACRRVLHRCSDEIELCIGGPSSSDLLLVSVPSLPSSHLIYSDTYLLSFPHDTFLSHAFSLHIALSLHILLVPSLIYALMDTWPSFSCTSDSTSAV